MAVYSSWFSSEWHVLYSHFYVRYETTHHVLCWVCVCVIFLRTVSLVQWWLEVKGNQAVVIKIVHWYFQVQDSPTSIRSCPRAPRVQQRPLWLQWFQRIHWYVYCLHYALTSLTFDHLVGLVVKASASRAEDPEFWILLAMGFFWVKSFQWLKHWHSSGYPARRVALYCQRWDWSAWCQYTVIGWGR